MAPDTTTGRDPPQRREARFAKRRCALHPGGLLPGCRERRPRRDRNGRCKPGVSRQGWKPARAETASLAPFTTARPARGTPGKGISRRTTKQTIIRAAVIRVRAGGKENNQRESDVISDRSQRRRGKRTGAAGARSSPFPEGNGLPGSLVVHARTMPARRKGPPANQQPLYKGASVQSDQHHP